MAGCVWLCFGICGPLIGLLSFNMLGAILSTPKLDQDFFVAFRFIVFSENFASFAFFFLSFSWLKQQQTFKLKRAV